MSHSLRPQVCVAGGFRRWGAVRSRGMTAEAAIPLEVPAQAPRPRALSPSRAADFMHCPLLYRFRTIDRLQEPPDAMATRGTVVHAVLERLFDLAPEERTLPTAAALIRPEWEAMLAAEP